MNPNLIIASSNYGKVVEFQSYLSGQGFQLLPKPDEIDVEETGDSFLANAHLKASQVALATGEWAIADDSGLEVNALNGSPGIYSARYGENDAERIDRLLFELGNELDRQAQFVCAIAVASPDGSIVADAIGICAGEILLAPRGEQGFGYDPVFYVPEYALTFAQMTPDLKAKISHRAKALELLRPKFTSFQLTS